VRTEVPFWSGSQGILVPVDASYYEDIAGRLRGVLIMVGDRLPQSDRGLIGEFIDHNELGLALEQIADLLAEAATPVRATERADMLALAQDMNMDDGVATALSRCPARS
jgi:hypothetical protein